MGILSSNKEGNKVQLTIEIELDSNSMLRSEEEIENVLNEVGVIASKFALEDFDTDGSKIEVEGKALTSKGKQKKISGSIWSNRSIALCVPNK